MVWDILSKQPKTSSLAVLEVGGPEFYGGAFIPSADMSWDDELLLPRVCGSRVFLHCRFGVRNSVRAGCWKGMWAISTLFMI